MPENVLIHLKRSVHTNECLNLACKHIKLGIHLVVTINFHVDLGNL